MRDPAPVAFPAGATCWATGSWFNAQGSPLIPNVLSYTVVDVNSGYALVPWTSIAPASVVTVAITSQQNYLINITRAFEKHQVIFQIIDGYGDTNYATCDFELVRIPGQAVTLSKLTGVASSEVQAIGSLT